MIWNVSNVALSVIVGLILAYKLAVLHWRFSLVERIGMGILGAGCILTIGPILWPKESPYENWAACMFRAGCCFYFVGRMLRHNRRGVES